MKFLTKLLILSTIQIIAILKFQNIDTLTWFTLGGFLYLSLLLYNLSYSFLGGISTPTFPEPSIVRMQISNFIDRSEDKTFANKVLKLSEVFDSTNALYLLLFIINVLGYIIT